MAPEKKLGRGFNDLASADVAFVGEEILQLPVRVVKPNRFQPRHDMSDDAFENLKASIARDGILQPIVVRPAEDGYELIAGERRWRAAAQLDLEVIPAIIRQADDQHALELALIENIQREDLNPIDRGLAFKQLMENFSLTQEQAAGRVGQDRSTVANTLRLLELPREVQNMVRSGTISMGHARALLSLKDGEAIIKAAERIAAEGLSVRAVEEMSASKKRGRPRVRRTKAPEVADLEERLRSHLGTKVEVSHGKSRGKIVVEYYSARDLERILERMGI